MCVCVWIRLRPHFCWYPFAALSTTLPVYGEGGWSQLAMEEAHMFVNAAEHPPCSHTGKQHHRASSCWAGDGRWCPCMHAPGWQHQHSGPLVPLPVDHARR
jgi:hypothetical protein